MKLDVLGILIFMVCLLAAYVVWCAYFTFWYLIGTKVERDFETMIQVRYEDGRMGHVQGYCFKPTALNNWIFKMYQKKFGA